MTFYELNMDGLVGPTHHYAGLSIGNIASTTNAMMESFPAAAALQGIEKMRFLHRLGLKQAVLPPQERPNIQLLAQLGFHGSISAQIEQAAREAPSLLSACYSASSMWAANTATVSSSLDTYDKRVHFTVANLVSNLHRHQESDFSYKLLCILFNDERYFVHHPALPKTMITRDEGAANHSRLCKNNGDTGVNLFVYGENSHNLPRRFFARQTRIASEAIARSHKLDPDNVVFACQNPEAIAQGVFHNDVIAVANETVLLLHEEAFLDQYEVLEELSAKSPFPLNIIVISKSEISIADAVQSYLFNSQLISIPASNNAMALIAPIECCENRRVKACIDAIIAAPNNPISAVHYVDLRQSMQNGGGPACLRLRVPLLSQELSCMHQGILVTDDLLDTLAAWVRRHYRVKLHISDLADLSLIHESYAALDELTRILQLGAIYPFQN